MENTTGAFLRQVQKLKSEYSIAPSKRSGDRERRRICLLLKDALLSLPVDDIRSLMAPVGLRVTSGAKPLTDVEAACFLADLFEIKLYQKLQGCTLSCDPSERETRAKGRSDLRLTLEGRDWEAEAQRIDLPLVGEVVNALAGNTAGPNKEGRDGELQRTPVVAKPDAGGEVARGFGVEQARLGAFAE